jgi:hypothetical protein
VKDGYVERVGNAYRVTDKVNIPDLQRPTRFGTAFIRSSIIQLAAASTV